MQLGQVSSDAHGSEADLRRQVRHRLANIVYQSLDFGVQNGFQRRPFLGMVAALFPQGGNLTALLLYCALQLGIALQSRSVQLNKR